MFPVFRRRPKKAGEILTANKAKKRLSMQEELTLILGEEERQRLMLIAVVDKAISGDMKAVEFVREILGEKKPATEELVIKLDKTVKELSQ